MPMWPENLRSELSVQGYREQFPDNTINSPVDVGPPKSRKRFTVAPRPFQGQMTLDNAGVEMLESFFANDLEDGALSFDFPKPRDPTTTITVKLVAPPDVRPLGPINFVVSLRFIQLP